MKKRWGWLGLVALLAVVVVFLGLEQSQIQHRFPLWEKLVESGEEPPPGMQLTLEKVEYDVYMLGEKYDFLRVAIANPTDQSLTFGERYFLGYFHEGAWYTVWMPEVVPAVPVVLEPGDVYRQTWDIPAGLLGEKGSYRLYIPGVGSCQWQGTDLP